MDTTILRHFLTIAREGSMTAAANELHISQPTLSVQMKQLEDTLGKKVFQKQGRNLVSYRTKSVCKKCCKPR